MSKANELEDDFDEDFDDDLAEEELIRLTAAPKRPSSPSTDPPPQKRQTVAPVSGGSTAVTPAPSAQDDILMTKGENAILRQQMQELVQRHNREQKKLKELYEHEIQEKASKLKAYTDTIKIIEDEKRFLDSEIKNLGLRLEMQTQYKKRKPSFNSQSQNFHHSTPANAALVPSQHVEPQIPLGPANSAPVISKRQDLPLEKDPFIQTILSHRIAGCERTTMQFLSRIRSELDFENKWLKVGKTEDIKEALLDYLVDISATETLNVILSRFISTLCEYCTELFNCKQRLPIPFLQALVHCAAKYRPTAVSQHALHDLFDLNMRICCEFSNLIRGKEDPFQLDTPVVSTISNEEVQVFVNHQPLQNVVLEIFMVTFALDLLEVGADLMRLKRDTKWMSLEQIDIILSSCSNKQTPANFVFNAIEILTASMVPKVFANKGKTDTTELVQTKTREMMSLAKLLVEGMDGREGMRFYGLNRMLGANCDIELLEGLVPDLDHPIVGTATVSIPLPLSHKQYHKMMAAKRILPDVYISQELHRLNARYKLLRMFELYFAKRDFLPFKTESLVELSRVCVWLLVKQQDYILRSPRCQTVSVRIKIIASVVRLLHHMCTETSLEISLIAKGTLREMITAFLSICSTTIYNEATKFVADARHAGYRWPIFNKSLELKNEETYNIAHKLRSVSFAEYVKDRYLIEEQIKADTQCNGLEVSFDDTTIELARDVLGLCVTGDEADSFYFSMNWVDTELEFGD